MLLASAEDERISITSTIASGTSANKTPDVRKCERETGKTTATNGLIIRKYFEYVI